MEKRLYRLLSSPTLALLLLIVFAVGMAVATFIENDYGTHTAWQAVYDAWWFEMVMLGLGVCFIMNIFKYKLLRREKWPILLFHIAFLIILVGAGITRYYSYGGIMRIREGAKSNVIISDDNYLKLQVAGKGVVKGVKRKVDFSPFSENKVVLETDYNDYLIELETLEFIPDAVPQVVTDSVAGSPLIELVVSGGNGRQSIFLKRGEVQAVDAHGHL